MSPAQMKTLLTRIGENTKFIISGDLDQSDRYKKVEYSGLYDAIVKHSDVEEIGFLEFGDDEIVRNPIIKKILANYNRVEVAKPIKEPAKEVPKEIIIDSPQTEEKKGRFIFFK